MDNHVEMLKVVNLIIFKTRLDAYFEKSTLIDIPALRIGPKPMPCFFVFLGVNNKKI